MDNSVKNIRAIVKMLEVQSEELLDYDNSPAQKARGRGVKAAIDLIRDEILRKEKEGTRYLAIKLKVVTGEYEFCELIPCVLPTKGGAKRFANKYAKDFYGGKSYTEDGRHFFNGGEVCVELESYYKITKVEYKFLTKIRY